MVPRLDMVVPCWICAPGQVPNCPYGLSGLVVWQMILQYVDYGNRILYILKYVSSQLKETRTVHHMSCWSVYFRTLFAGVVDYPIDMNSTGRNSSSYQRHSGLDSASHRLLATSGSETEAASKLVFHFKSDAVSFVLSRCEWKVVLSTPQLSIHWKQLFTCQHAFTSKSCFYFCASPFCHYR